MREAIPESVAVSIAPPSLDALRVRLVGRGTDSPEEVEERLRTAERELAAQPEFAHVVVDDRLEQATDELEGIVRRGLLLSRSQSANSPLTFDFPPPKDHDALISPRIDKLLDHVDSDYASVIVAASAPGRSTPTTTTSERGRSTSSRRRWSTRAPRTT